jgi:hypothetical protein
MIRQVRSSKKTVRLLWWVPSFDNTIDRKQEEHSGNWLNYYQPTALFLQRASEAVDRIRKGAVADEIQATAVTPALNVARCNIGTATDAVHVAETSCTPSPPDGAQSPSCRRQLLLRHKRRDERLLSTINSWIRQNRNKSEAYALDNVYRSQNRVTPSVNRTCGCLSTAAADRCRTNSSVVWLAFHFLAGHSLIIRQAGRLYPQAFKYGKRIVDVSMTFKWITRIDDRQQQQQQQWQQWQQQQQQRQRSVGWDVLAATTRTVDVRRLVHILHSAVELNVMSLHETETDPRAGSPTDLMRLVADAVETRHSCNSVTATSSVMRCTVLVVL